MSLEILVSHGSTILIGEPEGSTDGSDLLDGRTGKQERNGGAGHQARQERRAYGKNTDMARRHGS